MSNHYGVLLVIGLATSAGCAMQSPRVGQSATIQFGMVRSAEEITLGSNAPSGALVGGTLGLTMGRASSSPRRARNAIIGAGVGAALSGAAEGERRGMSYTVELLDGSSSTIVTDQREIRVGDCVAIERLRETANIRRVSASYCNRANAAAVRAVEDHARFEAAACQSAKQELVEAETADAADLATRKIELLCGA